MVDIGHRQTDEVLERLEKRLAEEYAQAYKDVEKKAADYFKRFEVKDKAKKALVDAGKLSEKDYQTWRRNQMLSGKRWTDLRDQLAKDLTNTNQIAAGIARGELNEVFAINANYSEYMIENGMRTNYGFTLYSRESIANLVANDPDIIPWKPVVDIPADLRWNRQMITSHITQGILQGESIPNLSKRLLKTVNNDKVAAVRTARTAVTSSQNAGRQMVYDRAKRMGLKLQKSWVATLDARTRHEHGAVDGQKVPLDGEFTVGGYKMKYPGDMSAPAHLVYNCRCTTITVEPDNITKGEEPRMTYSEWIESKEGKEAIQKKKDAEKQAREKEKEKRNKQKEREKAKQEKKESKKKPKIETVEEIQSHSTENLRQSYNSHIGKNNLRKVKAEEAGSLVGADYGKMQVESARAFQKTFDDLTKEYDTPLSRVKLMEKEEVLFKKDVFAYTQHNYETDDAEIIINPLKCGDYGKYTERIKELSSKGWSVKIPDKYADRYIATHEFAHSLANLEQPLVNSRNWVNADYGKIKSFRKEIKGVYDKYIADVGALDSARKKLEAKVYFDGVFTQKDMDDLKEYSAMLKAKKISNYSMSNADEFMAEAFTHAKLAESKNEYAESVLAIIDKYFKR